MTRGEIRAVILSKLRVFPGAVIYDVGAGSGSVAVESSLMGGTVYAVERNAEALELIKLNAEHFNVDLQIVEGEAPQAIFSLPTPQRIFVGGSGGLLQEIIEICHEKLQPGGLMVFASVTLDNGPFVYRMLEERGYFVEAVQLQSSYVRTTKGAAIWQGSNPVMIISGEKR